MGVKVGDHRHLHLIRLARLCTAIVPLIPPESILFAPGLWTRIVVSRATRQDDKGSGDVLGRNAQKPAATPAQIDVRHSRCYISDTNILLGLGSR